MKIMSEEWRKLSRAAKNKYFKRWKKDIRRERRAVAFVCPDCLRGFKAFEPSKYKTVKAIMTLLGHIEVMGVIYEH